MKKICFITVWIGTLPGYFDMWLKTVSYNPSIDWMLLTDDHAEYDYPKNVIVKYTTLNELKEKFQKIFPFEIKLENGYKTCDFRPAFGEIFVDELKDYDFWGHCDIDMLWGNIRKFIPDQILNEYDLIGRYGPFTLYRNIPSVNQWYKTLDDNGTQNYMDVFQSSSPRTFDEMGDNCGGGMIRKIINNDVPFFCCDEIRGILDAKKGYHCLEHDSEKDLQKNIYFYWEDGDLFCKGSNNYMREYAFIHFSNWKYIKIIDTIANFFFFNAPDCIETTHESHKIRELKSWYKFKSNYIKLEFQYWYRHSTVLTTIKKFKVSAK